MFVALETSCFQMEKLFLKLDEMEKLLATLSSIFLILCKKRLLMNETIVAAV